MNSACAAPAIPGNLFDAPPDLITAVATDRDHPSPRDRVDLIQFHEDVLLNDMQLSAARHHYRAQSEAVPQARAGLLPQLGTSATLASIHHDSEEQRRRSSDASRFKVQLSQPLFRLDRWYKLEAAHAHVAEAALRFASTEQTLVVRTAEAYFNALRALDMLATAEAETTAFKEVWDRASARLENGASGITEVLEAQAAHDVADANKKQAKSKVDDAFDTMYRLSGKRYRSLEGLRHDFPVTRPVPHDATEWVNHALTQNLLLAASNFAVTAANWRLQQSRAGAAPTVDIVMSYNRGDLSQRMIGLEVNLPLYSGGQWSSEVREAAARLAQAQDEREERRREVVGNVQTLHRTVDAATEIIVARQQAMMSSVASVNASWTGRELGSRSTADLLDAQRQLYNAVREYNNARYDYVTHILKLKEAEGTLDMADLHKLADYLTTQYDPRRDFLPPNARIDTVLHR